MDVLSELLVTTHIGGSVLAELRCGGAWGIDMETGNGIPFHYVMEGNCWLVGGRAPVRLSAGDLVVAPHWRFHALTSAPGEPLISISDVVISKGLPLWAGGTLDQPLVMQVGSAEPDVRILSGFFSIDGRGVTMLVNQLPQIIHFEARMAGLVPQLQTALDFIRQESSEIRQPGYVAVATRLMDLLLIQILRAVMSQPDIEIGLLAGLANPNLGRSLAAIHANPARRWTVATLAAQAGLSRTRFAVQFRQVMGVTPMHYVTRWRMTLAEDLLVRPAMSVEAVRTQLGFGSGFSFARAFRAHAGKTPHEYQKLSRLQLGPVRDHRPTLKT